MLMCFLYIPVFINMILCLEFIPTWVLKKYPTSKIKTPNQKLLYKSYYFSLIHSTTITILTYSYYSLSLFYSLHLHDDNSEIGNLIMSLTTSYFMIDLCYSTYLQNFDFVLHHLCAVTPIIISQITGNSDNFVIPWILLAEFTNPIQNIAWILKQHDIIYSKYIFVLYNLIYLVNRLLVSPFILLYQLKYLQFKLITIIGLFNFMMIYLLTCYWTPKMLEKTKILINEIISKKIIKSD